MVQQFLHFTFSMPEKFRRLMTARLVYGLGSLPKKGVIFEKDGIALYTRKGELACRMPNKLYHGRRLKRFLRDFAKSLEGLPKSLDFWVVPFR